jgi:hypothetical protein
MLNLADPLTFITVTVIIGTMVLTKLIRDRRKVIKRRALARSINRHPAGKGLVPLESRHIDRVGYDWTEGSL